VLDVVDHQGDPRGRVGVAGQLAQRGPVPVSDTPLTLPTKA
jgi:hypothetical protein